MPPRTRRSETDGDQAEKVDRPRHTADLCPECGAEENGGGEPHPTATSFGCEHGSWTFDQGPRESITITGGTVATPTG